MNALKPLPRAPRPAFRPRTRRLPKGNAVTIIAGFKCEDGIVVCSDTQSTVEPAKISIPKVIFEPSSPDRGEDHFSNLAAAFCGAGDGPFIDKLVDEAWKAAANRKDLDSACLAIERSIKQQYMEFGHIFQDGYVPQVELIYGVKMNRQSRLFGAVGPVINEQYGFNSGGQGRYMADFLGSKMYHRRLNVRQCVILAAYLVYQAKEHVSGCGNDTQVAVLRNKGTSGTVSWFAIKPLTDLLELVDASIGEILMALADTEQGDEEMMEKVHYHLRMARDFRRTFRDDLQKLLCNEVNKSQDIFGLPLPKDKE